MLWCKVEEEGARSSRTYGALGGFGGEGGRSPPGNRATWETEPPGKQGRAKETVTKRCLNRYWAGKFRAGGNKPRSQLRLPRGAWPTGDAATYCRSERTIRPRRQHAGQRQAHEAWPTEEAGWYWTRGVASGTSRSSSPWPSG